MTEDDFNEAIDGAGRDEEHYSSIDRLRISHDFLDSMRDENSEVGALTIDEVIELMEKIL